MGAGASHTNIQNRRNPIRVHTVPGTVSYLANGSEGSGGREEWQISVILPALSRLHTTKIRPYHQCKRWVGQEENFKGYTSTCSQDYDE